MNTPTWSRREFLELSGAAVGASLAPTSLPARRMPPSDTVRFGMVGVGMQGSGLLGESIRLPGVACAGAADLYDGRHTLAREIARSEERRVGKGGGVGGGTWRWGAGWGRVLGR